MLFSCQVILLAPGEEFKIISDYSDLQLQVLPTEGQYILFKPSNVKHFLTKVEAVLPIIDAQFGVGMRFCVRLRITNPAPKFVNLVDFEDTPTS